MALSKMSVSTQELMVLFMYFLKKEALENLLMSILKKLIAIQLPEIQLVNIDL